MKAADHTNGAAERRVRRRAVGPLDEFADLLFALFALDVDLKSNFLEALVLITEIVEIFPPPIKPAAHVLLKRIDLEIQHARRSSPLGEVTKAESGQKSMARTDSFTESCAMGVLIGNQFLIPDFGLSRAVFQPGNCHIRR